MERDWEEAMNSHESHENMKLHEVEKCEDVAYIGMSKGGDTMCTTQKKE